MPPIESEAKARTKARFDEVFQSYVTLSEANNNLKKKKASQGEQIVLDAIKKEMVKETTVNAYNAEDNSPVFTKHKERGRIPEDVNKSTPETVEPKQKKQTDGIEWYTTTKSLDCSDSADTERFLNEDRPHSKARTKKSKAVSWDKHDPYDYDDPLIEAYQHQVSQEETDAIKEKIRKKITAHLSELSSSNENQTVVLNNDTDEKKKKKKREAMATSEPQTSTRSHSELQDQPAEMSSIPSHSLAQVPQDSDDFIPKAKSKKAKKKSKTGDENNGVPVPEGNKEKEASTNLVYDDSLVLGVYIHRSDKLKTDVMVSLPMVKIHIVDQKTGEYVKKDNRKNMVSSFSDPAKQEYILPLVTQAYDFKRFKTLVPEWDEQIIFNERFTYFLQDNENREESPQVIMFFEILDASYVDGVSMTSEAPNQGKGFRKIAWAFLKLVGTNGVLNVDSRLRLQLYYPPSRSRIAANTRVYEWWLKYPRNRYPSTLYVTVKGLRIPENVNPTLGNDIVLQQEAVSNMSDFQNDLQVVESGKDKHKKGLPNWTRLTAQACRIPNKHFLSLPAGNKGCFCISFSNDGRTLAAACACRDGYPVYLYEIPSGQYLRELHGHLNLVYSLCWSKDDNHLLSSSSDGTVRLWMVGGKSSLKVLPHPSFVYAAKFHPLSSYLVVTGCFDAVIRVWNVRAKEVNGQLLQEFDGHKSFINTLCFDEDGLNMYSGDNSGTIIVWNTVISGSTQENLLEHWGISKEIQENDMKGIPVNHLEVHPNGRCLLIHTKDSTLRVMDLRILAATKYIGATNYREKIHSAFTPCGTFLFSGSEDGIAYVWNSETGDQVAKYNELSYSAPLRDVAFHPHENMVAFCAFGESHPIILYIYDCKVAQMEAEAVQTSAHFMPSGSSEIPEYQESYLSSADYFANAARLSMRMLKVKQKLDSFQAERNVLPAPSLLSPHSKLILSGMKSSHLITQPPGSSAYGGFSPVGQTFHQTASIRPQMAVALYNYTAHRSDELTIRRSDIIHVLYKDNDSWWFGSLTNGQQGYFPANYVATEDDSGPQQIK
ncbi:jouberin [Spea bombifrons]|uniref:jouberin n=1 Tax=Spea bombifrons TaxID=233779 RepID=UPI00234A2EB0|nr:jouberin [Spea bombifrons]XP_053316078.1 jouberin [Spea bombifrons]